MELVCGESATAALHQQLAGPCEPSTATPLPAPRRSFADPTDAEYTQKSGQRWSVPASGAAEAAATASHSPKPAPACLSPAVVVSLPPSVLSSRRSFTRCAGLRTTRSPKGTCHLASTARKACCMATERHGRNPDVHLQPVSWCIVVYILQFFQFFIWQRGRKGSARMSRWPNG